MDEGLSPFLPSWFHSIFTSLNLVIFLTILTTFWSPFMNHLTNLSLYTHLWARQVATTIISTTSVRSVCRTTLPFCKCNHLHIKKPILSSTSFLPSCSSSVSFTNGSKWFWCRLYFTFGIVQCSNTPTRPFIFFLL